MIRLFLSPLVMVKPQIYNRGRYSISNINQQLTICQQMLKIWCIHLFLFCNFMKKIGAFIVYSLSFNLANLNWPEEQSISIRNLCVKLDLCSLNQNQVFNNKKFVIQILIHLQCLCNKIDWINY